MRKSVVLDSEKEFWDQISINYMTEESDDEADQSQLVVRRILWRSKCKGINVMSGMHFLYTKTHVLLYSRKFLQIGEFRNCQILT